MAIIHTSVRNAKTEAVLKILDDITNEISLKNGTILMEPIPQYYRNALKLSLYLNDKIQPVIGLRNVFLEDVGDTVQIRYGNRQEASDAMMQLQACHDWNRAFPEERRKEYNLDQLIDAAKDVRDYLLVGKLPHAELSLKLEQMMTRMLPEKGFVEFDILPTLMDLL